jgi:hypothetical protein
LRRRRQGRFVHLLPARQKARPGFHAERQRHQDEGDDEKRLAKFVHESSRKE